MQEPTNDVTKDTSAPAGTSQDTGANKTESPAVKSGDNANTQATSPANTPAKTPDQTPFHDHPRFKEVTNENRRMKRELETYNRKMAELEARFNAPKPAEGPQLGDEESAALRKLSALLAKDPEAQKMLGLDKLQTYQSEIERLQSSRLEEKFESEMSEVGKMAASMGLDPNEIDEELRNAFQEHPVFSTLSYSPGVAKEVFKSLYFDKIGEIKEREANRKLIEQQESKRRANTEGGTSSAQAEPGSRKKGESIGAFISRRIDESGGIDYGR